VATVVVVQVAPPVIQTIAAAV